MKLTNSNAQREQTDKIRSGWDNSASSHIGVTGITLALLPWTHKPGHNIEVNSFQELNKSQVCDPWGEGNSLGEPLITLAFYLQHPIIHRHAQWNQRLEKQRSEFKTAAFTRLWGPCKEKKGDAGRRQKCKWRFPIKFEGWAVWDKTTWEISERGRTRIDN